jgi:hypothetical protein
MTSRKELDVSVKTRRPTQQLLLLIIARDWLVHVHQIKQFLFLIEDKATENIKCIGQNCQRTEIINMCTVRR